MTDLELDVWNAWLRERQEHLEETLSNISPSEEPCRYYLLSFIVNSVTKKQKREETAPTKVRSFSIPYNECCKQVLQDLCPNVLRLSRKQSSQCNYHKRC